MSKSVKPSIRTIGLEKYLNDSKDMHNNKGYAEFKEYLKYNVPRAAIGRLFHVGRPTIVKWEGVYKIEEKS